MFYISLSIQLKLFKVEMAQSEYHYGSDKSEVSSTISAKTAVQKGYARKGKTQLQKVEEEELAKKWEEENKRLRQLSRESSRRLAKIKKKEAEERLKATKEQDEALKRKKLVREQYYVHNIRKQVEKKPPQKKTTHKPDYKAVLHQKPIGCQRATAKPSKETVGSGKGKVEKDALKQANEVRLEDFLQPSSNLNGLDLDVRGSMQLTMRKMGIKEDSLMKQSDLLDSLDLQIAAIIGDEKVNEVMHNDSLDESQEIPEEIKDEVQNENKQLNTNLVQNWKKVNNNIRKEEQLRKIIPGNNFQIPTKHFNKIIPLNKEEVNSTLPKQADVLGDSALSDSLAPKGVSESKNIVDLSQSTEMAKLFGVNYTNDSLEASTFNWVKKNPELVKNMKELEPKIEMSKPLLKPEPIRTAIERAIQKEPEPHKETKQEPVYNELTFKEPLHKVSTPKEQPKKDLPSKKEVMERKEEKKVVRKVEQNAHNLKAESLSQMARKPIQKKEGPKSRATTVFTHEDDFDVDEFIMVLFNLNI